MTHICVGKLTILGSDNGLSPEGRQAIIWTNAGISLIGPSGIKFSEILMETNRFSFKKMHSKMSSGKCRPFCLGLNVLRIIDASPSGQRVDKISYWLYYRCYIVLSRLINSFLPPGLSRQLLSAKQTKWDSFVVVNNVCQINRKHILPNMIKIICTCVKFFFVFTTSLMPVYGA